MRLRKRKPTVYQLDLENLLQRKPHYDDFYAFSTTHNPMGAVDELRRAEIVWSAQVMALAALVATDA